MPLSIFKKFTEERALYRLYQQAEAMPRWPAPNTFAIEISAEVSKGYSLSPDHALLPAIYGMVRDPYSFEHLELGPWSKGDGVNDDAYRVQLEGYITNRTPEQLDTLRKTQLRAIHRFLGKLPLDMIRGSDTPFSCGIVKLFADPVAVANDLRFHVQSQQVRAQLAENEPYVHANKGDPVTAALMLLYGTPLYLLLNLKVPLELPIKTRFSGCYFPSKPGSGKTNILNGMVLLADLKKVAAGERTIIIVDSKSDDPEDGFLDAWRTVDFEKVDPRLKGKVHIFDPDADLAINIFDAGDVAQVTEAIGYMITSLIDFEPFADRDTACRFGETAIAVARKGLLRHGFPAANRARFIFLALNAACE